MPTVAEISERLTELLMGRSTELSDPNGSDLDFFPSIEPKPLERLSPPPDCWAVDGGQALVADARCLQVAVTRAARTRWQGGRCTLEEQRSSRLTSFEGAAAALRPNVPWPRWGRPWARSRPST